MYLVQVSLLLIGQQGLGHFSGLGHYFPLVGGLCKLGCPSKQPKLELKLVSALSETKRLFRLFRFYTETESFDVSIEPKQTEDPPKQFKREYIWVFFKIIYGCFGL